MVTAATAPVSHLERRPEASSFSIEDLLTDVARGRIRLPRFQRGLRWEDDDRIKLFDSIYRGFPVGTLLLWKRAADAETLEFGSHRIVAGPRSDALWVVDGQQRIATLAGALLPGPTRDLDERTLRFDLQNGTFDYGTDGKKPPPRWLPLSEVLDSARLLDWADRQALRRSGTLGFALEMAKRLREYQIPAYIVETDDEGVLRQVFDRSNSTGKALEASEVFDALHGAQAAEEPSSLRAIADSLTDLGFGRVEEKYVLRALLAVRRKDPGRGFRQIEAADAPAALADTGRALRQAVGFVSGEAGFPHYSLLPYKLPLATLSLFFHEHPDPCPRTRTLLCRWLWRGAISESHRGDTVALRSTLEAIVPRDEARSIQNLLKDVGPPPPGPLAFRPFNFRHARSKLQVVALTAREPRSLIDGAVLDIADLCERQHNPTVRLIEGDDPPEAGGLASRFIHPDLSPSRLRGLLSRHSDAVVLASHLVSVEAKTALHNGDFARALRCRERDLTSYVQEFLDCKAQWNPADRDRPPIEALLLEDA